MKTLYIIFLSFLFIHNLIGQELNFNDDTLSAVIWENRDVKISNHGKYTVFGILKIDSNLRWESERIYYDKRHRKIKSESFYFNMLPVGIQKIYEKNGELDKAFNHQTGKQCYGKEISFYAITQDAKNIADSVIKSYFSEKFINEHIIFCSSCIYKDYSRVKPEHEYMKYFVDSKNYFEETPVKPEKFRFYYPFRFKNAPFYFWRQIHIEIDSNLTVTKIFPSLRTNEKISTFDIDFTKACNIASNKNYFPKISGSIGSLFNIPGLRYLNDSFFWVFAKEYKNDETESDTIRSYLLINVFTGETVEKINSIYDP